jgi:hypothetical protein
MRLTLRTLLAYLDGILDPNDAQDIGKKIEESEFATGLVHRIRDVMRRMRLGAPSLSDRAAKLDPNTVAEYLDNTLASEAVTDFEKVSLDSDIHLAEVAACHQILTLVLGEPAEIDAASRDRMYQIKDHPTGPPAIPVGGAAAASVDSLPIIDTTRGDGDLGRRKGRRRPTVPEYLREPRRRKWLPAAAVVAVVCVIVAVLMALGQFQPGTPLGNELVRWGVVAPRELAADVGEPHDKPEKEAAAAKEPAKVEATTTKAVAEPGKESAKEAVKEPIKEPAKQSVPQPDKQPAAEPSKKLAGEKTDLVIKAETTVEGGAIVNSGVVPAPAQTMPVKEAEKQPPGEIVAGVAPKPGLKRGATEQEASKAVAAEPPPLPPEPMGRVMSSDQVLLKDDPVMGGWVRVAANQMLMPQRLLALPTYRPKVTLTVGVTLETLGGTQIELLASGPDELPGVRILYGRVVMLPVAKAGAQVRVAFGNRSGVLTFADPEAVAALDVRRIHAPGTDPEAKPPHVVAKLYATTGTLLWEENGGREGRKKLQLLPPQWVSFNGPLTSAPAASKDLPPWITADGISPLDRRASASIAQLQALPTDRLARVALLELTTSRPQKEVKWLALRCLACLGQYRDMVASLGDAARKPVWPDHIVELREAVARDADSAAAVRLALEKQYPQQATELYRMLWGYSDKDLQGGEDAKLVRGLDDESLAVRVLSSWNLRDIMGGRGQYYYPEQTAAKRSQSARRWRQLLDEKKIRLKTPEEKAGAAAEETTAPPVPEAGG